MKLSRSIVRIFLVFVALLTLPACKFLFQKEEKAAEAPKEEVLAKKVSAVPASDTSKVLVKVNGVPRITENGLNNKLKQMLQADPMTAAIDPAMMPVAVKQRFLGDWLTIVLIRDVWDAEKKISETPEFKDAMSERVEALEDALIVERFVDSLKKELIVSDSGVRKEFDSNRERYVKSAGGVRIAGAKFAEASDAASFKASVAGVASIADFEKAARALGTAQYRDFGRVSSKAPRSAPNEVVAAAEGLASMPAVVEAKSGGSHWVMFVLDKKDSEYYTFDEVKPQIQAMLEGQMFNKLLADRIESFKKMVSVEIDKDYQMPAGKAGAQAMDYPVDDVEMSPEVLEELEQIMQQ